MPADLSAPCVADMRARTHDDPHARHSTCTPQESARLHSHASETARAPFPFDARFKLGRTKASNNANSKLGGAKLEPPLLYNEVGDGAIQATEGSLGRDGILIPDFRGVTEGMRKRSDYFHSKAISNLFDELA